MVEFWQMIGMIKNGENWKRYSSRWYPQTLAKRNQSNLPFQRQIRIYK